MRIAVVSRVEGHRQTYEIAGISPVGDALGDEVLVRDQIFAAVAGIDRGIARAHIADATEMISNRDDIARLHRFVGEQNDAADQIRHDLLQAEAETDTDRAGEQRQHREVDAHRAQDDDDRQRHQRNADQLADQHLNRGRQVGEMLQPPVKEIADSIARPQRHRQQCRGLHHQ